MLAKKFKKLHMPRAFRAPRVASLGCHEARTRQAPKPPTLASDQADGFGSLPARFNISESEAYVSLEHPSWVAPSPDLLASQSLLFM